MQRFNVQRIFRGAVGQQIEQHVQRVVGACCCATNAWTPSRCGPLLNSWLFHKLVKIDVGERKSRTVELTQNVEVWIQLKASKVLQYNASTHNERRFETVHFIGLKWAVLLYSAFKQQFSVGVRVVEVF